MLRTLASGLLALSSVGLFCVSGAVAQAPAAGAGGSAPLRAAAPGPATVPGWNDVGATITSGNQAEKVTKGEVISFLSNYQVPDDDRDTVYRTAVEHVANTKLLLMYLARQKVPVTPERVDEAIEQFSIASRLDPGNETIKLSLDTARARAVWERRSVSKPSPNSRH